MLFKQCYMYYHLQVVLPYNDGRWVWYHHSNLIIGKAKIQDLSSYSMYKPFINPKHKCHFTTISTTPPCIWTNTSMLTHNFEGIINNKNIMHYIVVIVLSIENNLGNFMWWSWVFGFSTNVFLNSRGILELSTFLHGKQNVKFFG